MKTLITAIAIIIAISATTQTMLHRKCDKMVILAILAFQSVISRNAIKIEGSRPSLLRIIKK